MFNEHALLIGAAFTNSDESSAMDDVSMGLLDHLSEPHLIRRTIFDILCRMQTARTHIEQVDTMLSQDVCEPLGVLDGPRQLNGETFLLQVGRRDPVPWDEEL